MKIQARLAVFLVFYGHFAYGLNCDATDNNVESRIKRHLLCGSYDSSIRPVKNHRTTTKVSVKMLVKSYDFSDLSSTLTINAWMVNRWNDEFLTWDPAEFDGVKTIDLDSGSIWKPDFSLYNADLSYGIGSCHTTNCLLESTGNLSCIEPCTYVGHCQTDFKLWPFDKQNCSMIFGPWMNNEDELDYIPHSSVVTVSGNAQHMQWKLVSGEVYRKVYNISSKDRKFTTRLPNLMYSFIIERHSAQISKVIGSSCLILMCLNLLAIFVDSALNERLSLISMNLLLHFQLIHQISWMLPHEGDTVPRTLIFFRNSLIITCSLLIESLLVKALTTCERTPYPWMENLIQLIRRKQFGFIFLERVDDQESHDENNLIEAKEATSSPNKTLWKNIGSVLDKAVMLIVIVAYIIMILTLIPLHYTINSNVIEVA